MEAKIDLNSDLGEHPGSTLDEQIMPFISSCNIACGGHAGDRDSVKETVRLATENNVAIGAHPSFPDRRNFGRIKMEIPEKELAQSLRSQIELVISVTEGLNEKLHHVKPHGALYNLAARDSKTAKLVVEVVGEIDPKLLLYGLPNSEMQRAASELDLPFVGEAFADRQYEPDGSLRSRSYADAVIHDEDLVLEQVQRIVFDRKVGTTHESIAIQAQTICLHSDTAGAVTLAKAIQNHLIGKGATISAV